MGAGEGDWRLLSNYAVRQAWGRREKRGQSANGLDRGQRPAGFR